MAGLVSTRRRISADDQRMVRSEARFRRPRLQHTQKLQIQQFYQKYQELQEPGVFYLNQQASALQNREKGYSTKATRHLYRIPHFKTEKKSETVRHSQVQEVSLRCGRGCRDESNSSVEDLQTVSGENPQESEPLRDVNQHTTGREYYGRSSNFALLGQLFAHARSKLSAGGNSALCQQSELLPTAATSEGPLRNSGLGPYRPAGESHTINKSPLGADRLSIVNLLYDDETSVSEPNSKLLVVTHKEKARLDTSASVHSHPQNRDTDSNEFAITGDFHTARLENKTERVALAHPYRRGTFPTNQANDNYGRSRTELAIEKEYLRLFFTNLYYIHPFFSQTQFETRCETTIWSRWPLTDIARGDLHFVALYNVILAVGSLIGSQDTFMGHKKQLDHDLGASHSDMSTATSSIQLSRIFLDRSKRLLGDCFEICSLESAQTLMLMVSHHLELSYIEREVTDSSFAVAVTVLAECLEASCLLYVQWDGRTYGACYRITGCIDASIG